MTPEAKIVQACRRYLLKKNWLMVNLIQVSPIGMPDMLAVSPEGRYLWLEFKAERGRVTPIQKHMHETLGNRNCEVHVIRSLENLKRILDDD